jgi:CheY-like chemotaxis protein
MAHIAIREPQEDIRTLIEHVLRRLGHSTLTADLEEHADLLVLEPASRLDLDAAALLRARHPELPIVCVSIAPPFPKALQLGPSAYLMKPFTLTALRHAVKLAFNPQL